MRRAAVALAALLLAAPAQAQLVHKCGGETFAALAGTHYGREDLGPMLAHFNGQKGERCEPTRPLRLPQTVRHTVAFGQTFAALAARFLRAAGREELLRAHNRIPAPGEPSAGSVIEIPVEMAIVLGANPAADLEALALPVDAATLRRYNQLGADWPAGRTIYAPIFVEVGRAAPPPPPPPPVVAVPNATVISTEPPHRVAELIDAVKSDRPARFDRYLHDQHERIGAGFEACARCHPDDVRVRGALFPVPEEACLRCHPSAETRPRRTAKRPSLFSHAVHLVEGRGVARAGQRLSCEECHALGEDGRRAVSSHPTCVRCHNANETPPAIERDCEGCHPRAEVHDPRAEATALLAEHLTQSVRHTDIRFDHAVHEAALGSDERSCARCHPGAETSERVAEIEPSRMSDCLSCHRGLEQAIGERKQLDRCRTCHIAELRSAVPSFDGLTHKPLSHSPEFRRRHAAAARDDDGTCAVCHLELAQARGDRCDRCHVRSLPQDHTARWREEPHGRAALRDPERCATCHAKDRCADCHALAPRDHFPRSAFVRDHKLTARRSVRRCQTCHDHRVDCARCHGEP